MTSLLRFSLIVCTRGRPALLERLLRGVALLRYPAFELIVVYDPHDPETSLCLARHAKRAKICHCAVANLAKARNIGLSVAEGEIAAFIDDDALPSADWLDRLAACYATPETTAAGGFILASKTAKFLNRFVVIDPFGKDHRSALVPRTLAAGWFLSLTGTNFSVRRAAAIAVGGFDENYPYFLEETDFLLRLTQAGGKIAVDPLAAVFHDYAESDKRAADGTPRSLHVIARSKAYFCHINRRPEASRTTINRALTHFMLVKLWMIAAHFFRSRLSGGKASWLYRELRTGLGDGEMLAKEGRSLMAFPLASAAAFKPFQDPPSSQPAISNARHQLQMSVPPG